MREIEPLPLGPCEATDHPIVDRIVLIVGIALTVVVLVLSILVSPVFFVGYVAVCAVFGVLQAGWRWLRKQP
jgi:hypothetical protein